MHEYVGSVRRVHNAQMRAILVALACINDGATTSYNGAGGRSTEHPGGIRPIGELFPAWQRWQRIYNEAGSDRERQDAIDGARAELHAIKHSPRVETVEQTATEVDTEIRSKIADGWAIPDVARAMHVTATRVRQALAAPVEGETADEATVRELAAQGLTVRNISMRTKIAKSQVHRILKRAA